MKKVLIISLLALCGLTFVIHVIAWLMARTGPLTCVDQQKLVSVTPVGHRSYTSYIVAGDRGGSEEYINAPYPPRVGYQYCFRQDSPHYDVDFWTLERR